MCYYGSISLSFLNIHFGFPAAIPWKSLSYEKLKELYVLWKTGIRLPQDGTYPGSLLDLLVSGLKLDRSERIDLMTMAERLKVVKVCLHFLVLRTRYGNL